MTGPPANGSPWRLERLLVVADAGATRGRPLEQVVARAVAGGARAVWLRARGLPADRRRELAHALRESLSAAGGVLLSSPGPGAELATGVHLGSADPLPSAPGPYGRSCHSATELARAAAGGCRWATLSPIFASVSKPGYGPVLGTGALAGAPLPVWALGGVTPENAASCLAAGAAGVAVLGAVMGAQDPAVVVQALLRSLGRPGMAA